MSLQVKQLTLNPIMQNSVRVKTGPPVKKKVERIDFDTMYVLAITGMIWGGFIAAFWYM